MRPRKGPISGERVRNKFIYPGVGYGGSCFPKDVKALIKTADENGYSLRVLKAVEHVNDDQKSVLFNKVIKYFNNQLKDKTIAMWGLSFKPETDDMRESPALVLIEKFLNAGARVKAYDPAAMEEAKRRLGNKIEFVNDQYEALIDADCLLIVTEWTEFRVPNLSMIKKLLEKQRVKDQRELNELKLKQEEIDIS